MTNRGRNVRIRDDRRNAKCEHPAYHPDEPSGFRQWMVWAEEKTRTHTQKRCPHCGLWVIWEPRE